MTTYREADMHSSSRIGLTSLLIIGSLLLTAFSPCASASDVTVFSKTYIRETQKPQVFTDTFTCSQPGNNFILAVKNGKNGSFRGSSALIWINGKQILRVSDFNNQVNSLTRSVVLKANNEIKIEISDNGPGIPKESIDKIFDPFYTTKEVGKGTGLGLSIVYSIIEKLGGRIMVASEIGQGTTFNIYLPVK